MSDPTIPVLRKLLSLNTPVAERILEIALLLGLVWGADYMRARTTGMAQFAAFLVLTFCSLVLFAMAFVLVLTILGAGSRNNPSGDSDS